MDRRCCGRMGVTRAHARGRRRPKLLNFKSQRRPRRPRPRPPLPTPPGRNRRAGRSSRAEVGCRLAAGVCAARAGALGARGFGESRRVPTGSGAQGGATGPEKGEAEDPDRALVHPGEGGLAACTSHSCPARKAGVGVWGWGGIKGSGGWGGKCLKKRMPRFDFIHSFIPGPFQFLHRQTSSVWWPHVPTCHQLLPDSHSPNTYLLV